MYDLWVLVWWVVVVWFPWLGHIGYWKRILGEVYWVLGVSVVFQRFAENDLHKIQHFVM